jgi:hypothetical protein
LLEESSRGQAADGFHCAELAWEDSDPDRLVLIVHFNDRVSYLANAATPAQDAEYHAMLEYLEGEPEWIDIHYAGYRGQPLP